MSREDRRLRQVHVSDRVWAILPRDLPTLAQAIGLGWGSYRAETPKQLTLEGLRVNGERVEIFVHCDEFELEKCWCRAPLWEVPHLAAIEAAL